MTETDIRPEHAAAIRAFDYLAAAAFGTVAALGAWLAVPEAAPVVPAMVGGMLIGVISTAPVLGLVSRLLGGFEILVMAMQIGMLGGMVGVMVGRGGAGWPETAGLGAGAGLLVQLGLHVLDLVLRGEIPRVGPS